MEHYFIVMWVDGNTVKCVSLCVCVRVCHSRMCVSLMVMVIVPDFFRGPLELIVYDG